MNTLVYLPNSLSNNDYPVVIDKDTIRVYHSEPIIDDLVNYTDYYVNSHYLERNDSEVVTKNYTILNNEYITNNIWYRNDISDIMLTFSMFMLVVLCLITFILKCFFRGLFK